MSTYNKIKQEIISAMKSKNSERLLALRSLDSTIKNISITNNNRETPTEAETIQGISQSIKRGMDSAEQFKQAGRADLLTVEQFQVNVFKEFLPEQMSKEELKQKISEELNSIEGLSQKDFGKFMKMFGEKYRGLTDNKTISETIKQIFTENGVK
jgi:uncharacterized protein YqeY